MSEDKVYPLNEFVQVYATPDTLDGVTALSQIEDGQLLPLLKKTNPGITNSAYWIQIELTNKTDEPLYYIEVDYPQLDYLQLYEIEGDTARLLFETGDRFIFNRRPVQYRNFTFPLELAIGEKTHLLLNVDKRNSAARFPLILYPNNSFWKMYNQETIFYGFCFGFLALVVLISLIVGYNLKMTIFIWYALYVLTFGLRCFAKLGYGYQFIASDYPELNTHLFPFSTQLALVFLIMYIQRYFDTKKTMPRFNKVMNFLLILFVISSIIWIVFPSFIVAVAPLLISMRYVVVVTIIVFAYASAENYLRIDRFSARIFLVGYSVFFLGVFSQILMEYGAIDRSLVPGDPLFVGFFIEVGVLSYGMLAILVNIIKEKNKLAIANVQLKNLVDRFERESKEQETSYVMLKSKAVVDPQRIRYIQSDDHYLEFYLNDKDRPEVDRNKLSAILEILPAQFVQIHRSTIVNLEYVKTIYGNYLLLNNGEELKLSRTYKSQLEERLAK
ncbi:7TM diverse intracellular signaling domain-containing protein [Ekhidna sp. To15]|uniref:7TM diverse intracellular signaling domain-containing protein n=1 Tax=Ekhidna sp. To15 TaxID=3395267 RepID=UPI003F520D8C